MPVPPPTLPSATGPRFASAQRLRSVLGSDVETVDVVEVAVPGLGHHRQRPPVARCIRATGTHALGDHRIAHHADAVRVGQHHRAFQLAGFLEPCRAGHLAVAVEREPRAEHRSVEAVVATRQDRGDAGAHLVPVRQVLDQRDLADGDAGDVGDRIERTGRAFERNAQIARAGLRSDAERDSAHNATATEDAHGRSGRGMDCSRAYDRLLRQCYHADR